MVINLPRYCSWLYTNLQRSKVRKLCSKRVFHARYVCRSDDNVDGLFLSTRINAKGWRTGLVRVTLDITGSIRSNRLSRNYH